MPGSTHSPSAAVAVAAPSSTTRPDEAVRSAWVDPSSFMTADQARARDRFLTRIDGGGDKSRAEPTPKPSAPTQVTDSQAHNAAAPASQTPQVPTSANQASASVFSSHEPSPPPPPASRNPVLSADKVTMGDFHGGPRGPVATGGGRAAHVTPREHLPGRRRRREGFRRADSARRVPAVVTTHLARQILAGTRGWSIYSTPPASYYVAQGGQAPDLDSLLPPHDAAHRAGDVDPQHATSSDVSADPSARQPALRAAEYVPMHTTAEARQPPAQHGRILEEQRYNLPRCQPYRIPLYDQACLKHIFPNLFDPDIQFMEVFYWAINLILVIVQIVMVIVNVFFNDPQAYLLQWVRTASVVIFSVEFGVTMALVIFLIITIVHACVTKNIGTKLAQDIGALTTFISTFSILRAVGLASPTFAMRRIFPRFASAIGPRDIAIGAGMVIVWLAVCALAFVALIVKVTQIDFAYSSSIEDWTFTEFVQLIGLVMNLARVDDSYYKETAVLLDAIHRHFSTPGEAREANSMEKPCLLERLMRALGIPNYMYYEYFDSIFNYHMDWSRFEDRGAGKGGGGTAFGTAALVDKKKKTYNLAYQGEHDANEACTFDDIPMRMKWRNMFNYLSFVFEIDTVQLRRYLQMVQSPLPFYRVGRESFLLSFAEADALGMDMAVWRSDPIGGRTRRHAKSNPDQFITRFVCEDRRDVWDPDYQAEAERAESRETLAFARALDKRQPPSLSSGCRVSLPPPPLTRREARGATRREEGEEVEACEPIAAIAGADDTAPRGRTTASAAVADRQYGMDVDREAYLSERQSD